jgi:hypothetical protein
MDETVLFYNPQLERALALKGEEYQGGREYKDRVMVLLFYCRWQ